MLNKINSEMSVGLFPLRAVNLTWISHKRGIVSATRSPRWERCFPHIWAIQTSHRGRTCEIQCVSIFYTRTLVPKIWFWREREISKLWKQPQQTFIQKAIYKKQLSFFIRRDIKKCLHFLLGEISKMSFYESSPEYKMK